jgi:hypothetical protein
MTITELHSTVSQAFHEGSQVWVPDIESAGSLGREGNNRRITSWRRGVVQASVEPFIITLN